MKTPKVSVLCLAFNQIKFIRQALDGFVSQKTDFDFEVVINDDASTDGTAGVIREYQARYPDIIKPIFQKENQYSKGVRGLTVRFLLPAAAGEYISLCEGDDYFTDPNKLQAQSDFLDQNPDHALCFHPVRVIYENNEAPGFIFPPACDPLEFNLCRLMQANFIQTNSVMYRRREYTNMPVDILPSDWYLHLYHARYGKIGFLDRVMSVYRRHPGGIWWSAGNDRDAFFRKHGPMHLSMYLELLKLFGYDDGYRNIIMNNITEMVGCVLNVAQKDKWQDHNEAAKLVKRFLGGTGGLDKVKTFVERRCSAGGEENALAIVGSNPAAVTQAIKSVKFLIGSAWKSRFSSADDGVKDAKNGSAIRLEMDTGLIAKNGLKSADVCRNAALSAGGKIAGRKNISNLSETLTIALDDSADTAIAAGKIFSAECTNASGETVKVADCLKTRSCVADIVVESKIHLELPVRDPHNPSGVRDIFAAIDLHCPQPVASAIREKLGDLTLISCANNTPEILIVMLKSFKAHHGEGPHRLILFENSAGEDTANLLNNNRVPHIRNAGGTYAGTVDEAIKSCPTKHALVVDPAIVFNQSVIPLYEAFIKNDGIIMGDTCGVPARMQSLFMFIDVEKVNRAGISFLGSGASFYSEIRNAGLNVIQCKADPDFFTSYTDSSSGSKIGEINCETAKYGAVEIKDSFIPGFSGGIGSLKNIVEIPRMEHAISAVVPVLCWTPAAVRAIESLAGQMGEKDEVIVVAEDDPGAGITAGSIPAKTGVKILTAVKNARLASMYNAGIKASSGGVIILSREDIICGKGFFEDHRRGHKEHPGVGAAIIGNIYATKQSHGDTINPYLNGGGIEQVDFGALGGTMCNAGPGFFNTSCVSVKKEFLLDNGAFDEVFGDIITPARELGRRLFENGMELVHVPDISVAWEHPLKFMEYARIRYLEGRAYPYFLDKLLRKRDGKDFAGPLPDDGITWDELMAEKNLKWANVIKSGNTADIKKYVFAICRESFFRGARDAAAENSMGEMLLFENGKWGAYKTGKSGAYVSLLSEYDPEREARLIASRIPADKNVVFIGAGMGRHINEYLSGGTSRRAALYEPHDTLFDYLTTKMDMERITRIKERGELDALKNKGYEAVILPSLRNTECEYSEAYKSFLPDGAAIPG